MRILTLTYLLSALAFCQSTPDPRGKAECEETATRLSSLLSVLPKDGGRPKACAALRDEAGNQLRLSIAVEKAACEGPAARGLTVPLNAQIERRTTGSTRMLDLMRECEEISRAIESAQPKAIEARKPQEITSCVIYKQSWDDRQIDKRSAAIRKADPDRAKCKLELPTAYAAHCGAQKKDWPQEEFGADLAGLIKVAIEMSRCEADLQIKK